MAVGGFWANSHFFTNPKRQSRGILFPGCLGFDNPCGPCVCRLATHKNRKTRGMIAPAVLAFSASPTTTKKIKRGSKPRGSYASFAWASWLPLSTWEGTSSPPCSPGLPWPQALYAPLVAACGAAQERKKKCTLRCRLILLGGGPHQRGFIPLPPFIWVGSRRLALMTYKQEREGGYTEKGKMPTLIGTHDSFTKTKQKMRA